MKAVYNELLEKGCVIIMAGSEVAVTSGFKEMVEKQRHQPGRAWVTTVLFNDELKVLHDHVVIEPEIMVFFPIPLAHDWHEDQVSPVGLGYATQVVRIDFVGIEHFRNVLLFVVGKPERGLQAPGHIAGRTTGLGRTGDDDRTHIIQVRLCGWWRRRRCANRSGQQEKDT